VDGEAICCGRSTLAHYMLRHQRNFDVDRLPVQ